MRAVEQVLPMLEMKEDEIVSYIKSGALKNVMYVEQFRGIAKSIYKEQPIVEYSEQYMVEHPISMIAESEGSYYFTAGGFFFKTNEDGIYEADGREVSSDFHIVKNMLESGVCKYADNTITMQVLDRTYSLFEQDEQVKCTITLEDKVTEYTVDQLRENNNYFIQATPANLKAHRAAILEGFAKVYENYKSIAILNNVSIISNNNDRFLLIENNGHAYARILQTNHSQPWEVKGDIAKVVESVKKYTHINVTKLYEQSIEHAVTETEKNEKQQIKENLEKSEIEQRKEKIRELTERFKDDPVRLEMLSRVAADLAALDQ
jgi:hypothetical protein